MADSSTDQFNFLSVLAEGIPPGSHFLVAKRTPKDTFPAETWREQHLTGPWYFSTGASDHSRLRKHTNMTAVRAIVLDDVGPKVDRAKVLAAPTWELETSPGNFQLGFMLKAWEPDIARADALFTALVEAGLQDPGVNRACRLFRLPGSINNKKGRDNFAALLHSFDAGIVYTLTSLAKALGVRPGKPVERRDAEEPVDLGDPIFRWLDQQGMVRHETGDGWYEIACPWGTEHTDGRDEAKYRPSARPGVMCYHGHGLDGGAYRAKFFDWVVAQGGPAQQHGPDPARVRAMYEGLSKKHTQATTQTTQPPAVDLYDYETLVPALGVIKVAALPQVDLTAKGKPKLLQPCVVNNVLAALRQLNIQPRLNLMDASTSYVLPERIDMRRFGVKLPYEIDRMITGSLEAVFHQAGMTNKKELRDCIARIASSDWWHPAKAWIEGKPWDGQDRLEHLIQSVSTPTPDLFRTYFRRWLLQTVEAACGWVTRPKQQKSLCLVLAGKQGVGKTRWLASLTPDAFNVSGKHLSLDGFNARDSKHEALQGLIVELGELDTTFKKSANGSLKAFLSDPLDEYRLPYANEWLKRPRCTSFCASVNNEQFLQDETGSRRYAVIWVDQCDADHATDMQQLFAQVYKEWADGIPYWLTAEEMTVQIAANAKHQAVDGTSEMVDDEVRKRLDHDVYTVKCGLGAAAIASLLTLKPDDPSTTSKITARMIEHCGKPRDLRKWGGGSRAWPFWVSTDERRAHKLVSLTEA